MCHVFSLVDVFKRVDAQFFISSFQVNTFIVFPILTVKRFSYAENKNSFCNKTQPDDSLSNPNKTDCVGWAGQASYL